MAVLVTGAGGGIGRAIVASFQAADHPVFTQDLRPLTDVDLDVVGDVLDTGVLDQLVALVSDNDIDTVVAAHGIAASAAVSATSRDLLHRAMAVNTLSFIELFEALDPLLRARRGCFVAVSSQAGLVGEANNGPYCASKFGLVGWAKGRAEIGQTRVRVLCPGATETPLLMNALQGMADAEGITLEHLLERRNAQTAAGRLGHTEEIGRSARWLAELPHPDLVVAAVTGGEVLY